MFLDDTILEQLPRQLQQRLRFMIMPYSLLEATATVVFEADGRSLELEVDPDTGLTDAQIAQLCVTF